MSVLNYCSNAMPSCILFERMTDSVEFRCTRLYGAAMEPDCLISAYTSQAQPIHWWSQTNLPESWVGPMTGQCQVSCSITLSLTPRDSVSLNPMLDILLDWMASGLLGSTYLCPWNTGLQAHAAILGFYMNAGGSQLRPLLLCSKFSHTLSHLPRPRQCFKKWHVELRRNGGDSGFPLKVQMFMIP